MRERLAERNILVISKKSFYMLLILLSALSVLFYIPYAVGFGHENTTGNNTTGNFTTNQTNTTNTTGNFTNNSTNQTQTNKTENITEDGCELWAQRVVAYKLGTDSIEESVQNILGNDVSVCSTTYLGDNSWIVVDMGDTYVNGGHQLNLFETTTTSFICSVNSTKYTVPVTGGSFGPTRAGEYYAVTVDRNLVNISSTGGFYGNNIAGVRLLTFECN